MFYMLRLDSCSGASLFPLVTFHVKGSQYFYYLNLAPVRLIPRHVYLLRLALQISKSVISAIVIFVLTIICHNANTTNCLGHIVFLLL